MISSEEQAQTEFVITKENTFRKSIQNPPSILKKSIEDHDLKLTKIIIQSLF